MCGSVHTKRRRFSAFTAIDLPILFRSARVASGGTCDRPAPIIGQRGGLNTLHIKEMLESGKRRQHFGKFIPISCFSCQFVLALQADKAASSRQEINGEDK